ncbi:hypothetical protein ACJH6J_29935 [Mycobacterium sp. SMC-18]|uniref:hypothetical protein n=1 Tax=Mycobacterium TaxID=1763 RepID=UPI001158916E|nr:hypothetical protein [Mycobacterium kansasii]
MTIRHPATRPVDAPIVPVPGWRLTFAAGFVPITAGLIILAVTWISAVRANSPYWLGTGTLDFTHASLTHDAAAWLDTNGSVGGVNIIAAAAGVLVISRFGLRAGHRWAWWFLAFSFVWVGLHDAVMATRFFFDTGQPFMLMPYTFCALLAAGLLRSRRAIFGATTKSVTG